MCVVRPVGVKERMGRPIRCFCGMIGRCRRGEAERGPASTRVCAKFSGTIVR